MANRIGRNVRHDGGGDMTRASVTDPRPVPLASVWAILLAVVVPTIYVLWVFIAIPVASSGDDASRSEELSYAILGGFTRAVAPIAVVLGIVGVLIVRRDPHLYRWQWVGFTAIGIGCAEIIVYVASWLG